MPQCFEHTMDTLMTFESSYKTYTTNYIPNDWTSSDIRKLWHIIYNVAESEVGRIAALTKERGAGLIEITNDIMPNPYDNLPSDTYMQTQMNAFSGGLPSREDPRPYSSGGTASTPGDLKATPFDYSSAHLTWSASANAIGYRVYLGGSPDLQSDSQVIVTVPNAMTEVTVGGLAPGSTNTFTVAAMGGDGVVSGPSNSVTITATSLPGGKTVVEYSSSPSAESTTFKADVLVPYAFVRLYIFNAIKCDWEKNPGWPVNDKTDGFVYTH